MKRALLAALAAMALAASGCGGGDDDSGESPAAGGRDRAMLFRFEQVTDFTTLDGRTLALADLRGRVVMIDFFGTWCPPCRRSMPVLVSLYERFHGQGLEVVGLAYEHSPDQDAARRAVEAFRDEFKVPYPLAFGPPALWQELQEKAAAQGVIPTIVLVDKQGIVRDVFEGLPPGHEAVLADRIERLLAEQYGPAAEVGSDGGAPSAN